MLKSVNFRVNEADFVDNKIDAVASHTNNYSS